LSSIYTFTITNQHIIGGFFYCKANTVVSASSYGSASKFTLRKVSSEVSKKMRDLALLSRQIQDIQSSHIASSMTNMATEKLTADIESNALVEKRESQPKESYKICLGKDLFMQ
jgi:hypothetical protein